jgi:hypothetical protein
MRHRTLRVSFSVGLLLCGAWIPMSTGQRWHEIAVGEILVFSSPVELSPTSAQGIDSAFGEWQGENLLVRVDAGLFADPLTRYAGQPDHETFDESIDGQPARGVAFDQGDGSRFTAVHFPDLGQGSAAAKKLTFVVISRGSVTAEDALRIVRSIRVRR